MESSFSAISIKVNLTNNTKAIYLKQRLVPKYVVISNVQRRMIASFIADKQANQKSCSHQLRFLGDDLH